jgi:hypothetical protein
MKAEIIGKFIVGLLTLSAIIALLVGLCYVLGHFSIIYLPSIYMPSTGFAHTAMAGVMTLLGFTLGSTFLFCTISFIFKFSILLGDAVCSKFPKKSKTVKIAKPK